MLTGTIVLDVACDSQFGGSGKTNEGGGPSFEWLAAHGRRKVTAVLLHEIEHDLVEIGNIAALQNFQKPPQELAQP